MSANKKYFWLKQPISFFDNSKLKKLRKIAGGDIYTIIYQKIMLLSVPNSGIIKTIGLEDTLAGELSLSINEEQINVQITLDFMAKFDLIEELDENTFLVTDVPPLVGKEGASAQRVREYRKRKALHCNKSVTKSNTEIELNKEIELEQKDSTQPSLEEVEKYIIEHNYQVDAIIFLDYYRSRGWYTRQGKPIKNWKLTLRSWHLKESKNITDNRQSTSVGIVGIA